MRGIFILLPMIVNGKPICFGCIRADVLIV